MSVEGASTPGARVTSRTLYVFSVDVIPIAPVPGPPQWMAERKCPPAEMTPSDTRKPAASSMS
jgi:hypothetical protein